MKLTHVDEKNNPTMVDVSNKVETFRSATAVTLIALPDAVASQIDARGELSLAKGPVFQTAIIAGTMATKKTSELIPFCHPLNINSVKIDITPEEGNTVKIVCTVKVEGKTGVEMEALTGSSVAALTVYDMCKALSHDIEIKSTKLLEKTGGKRTVKGGRLCD